MHNSASYEYVIKHFIKEINEKKPINGVIELAAEDIPFNPNKKQHSDGIVITAENVQDAIDQVADEIDFNAVYVWDATIKSAPSGLPRGHQWHVRMPAPLEFEHQYRRYLYRTVEEANLDDESVAFLCWIIDGRHVRYEYFDENGEIERVVVQADTDGTVLIENFFPLEIGEVVFFGQPRLDIFPEDDTIRSLININVKALFTMIGDTFDLHTVNKELVGAINEALAIANMKINTEDAIPSFLGIPQSGKLISVASNGRYELVDPTGIGEKGDPGEDGEPGPPNVLSIGSVTETPEMQVSITGLSPTQVLNFGLRRGERGERGAPGDTFKGVFMSVLDLEDIPTDDLGVGDVADVAQTKSRWTWNISYLGDVNNYDFACVEDMLHWYFGEPLIGNAQASVLDFFYNSTTNTIWQQVIEDNTLPVEEWVLIWIDTEEPYPPFDETEFNEQGLPIWDGVNPFNPELLNWIDTRLGMTIEGPQGETGAQGIAGPANTLNIGTVASGQPAGASITGVSPNQTLNLTLPQGPQGIQGNPGTSVLTILAPDDQTMLEWSLANPNNIYYTL